MFKLAQVDPTKLDLVKDAVTPGLEHISRHNEDATATPEQIYSAVREGRAELFAAFLDEQYGGFVLLGERWEISGERRLLVWCVYMERRFPRARELRELVDREIDEIARRRGIHKVYFHTSRDGWDREAPRLGFHKYETVWMREVK